MSDEHRGTHEGWLPPVAAPPPPRRGLRRLGPIGVALLALAQWGKALLLLLPEIKVLSTAGTALVSVAAYAVVWGWRFAVIFVALLFVHEMGHVLQLRREGIKASAPMFIPFLGALVSMKELPGDAAAEARVGLAGPVLGSLAAVALLPLYWATGSELWLNLAYVGFLLNLFNLVPVTPLDGGRAMAALSPWMWFVGLFAVALLTFLRPNPVLVLILVLGALDVFRRWRTRRADHAYYTVTRGQRALIGLTYLVLLVGLGLLTEATYVARDL